MNFLSLLEDIIVIYIIYKVVFGFVVPLFTATKHMKGTVDEMNRRMQEQQRAEAEHTRQYEEQRTRPQVKIPADDYIDYEEVKN